MKHTYSFARVVLSMVLLLFSAFTMAEDVTYDLSTTSAAGWKQWTASVKPNGFETTGVNGNDPRGAQFSVNATLTLTTSRPVSKVVVVCSANTDKNSLALAVGGKSWGSEKLAKVYNTEKVFTGSASGDIVINLTRAEKSIYVKTVTVTYTDGGGTGGEGGGDIGGGDEGDEGNNDKLDPTAEYDEPTIVTVQGTTGTNMPYSFIHNNILVETSTGAIADTYFGCNAGQTITFTATQPIKGIVINGYVKQGFAATCSDGDIYYVDAEEDAVESDPVVVLMDVDSKSVTINCVKQLRVYSAEFYFEENPDVDIDTPEGGEEGNYTYDWEPTTPTKLNMTFDELEATDYTADLGMPYTDLYFIADEFEMELGVFSQMVDGTYLAPGKYQITDTYEEGTVQASPGGDDMYDYPAYIATDFEYSEEYDGWYYNTAYYIVSGTLTVTALPGGVKMVLDGTTYYGSTVHAEYIEGDNIDEDAILNTKGDKQLATRKLITKDGKVLICHDGNTYTSAGLKVK